MKYKIIYFVLFLCSDIIIAQKEWWETAAFYQIYPRSFKDSNGDGIGDINGIIQQLEYLKEIGIKATWLSPIFKSPMYDFGYDIADFFDIQPEFGTIADFENLVQTAHGLNIKVIMDFVPNHSSHENEWFVKSVNKEPGYEDFYIWHPGYVNPNDPSKRLPPSNWIQSFRGSAWEWNEIRQEFYLHQFTVQQPDLNYRNPLVVETMKSVLTFWMEKGVDGFRIDAVPVLFEALPDATGKYPDEPLSNIVDDPDDNRYLRHIYTQDLDETLDMVYQWRAVLDDFKAKNGGDTRVIMTESYSPIETVMKYYGDGQGREGSNIPFNFLLMPNYGYNAKTAANFEQVVKVWLQNLPTGRTANWVIGNHDQRRVASRYGVELIDPLLIMVQSLPGASITYNGDEIGMTDVEISWEDSVDPAACNSDSTHYQQFTRDPGRTPMQWDGTKNAGFSTADKTWLPISTNYREVNVAIQKHNPYSHLGIFKMLTTMRHLSVFQYGDTELRSLNDVLSILRTENIPNQSVPNYFLVLINFGITTNIFRVASFNYALNSANMSVYSSSYNLLTGKPVSLDMEIILGPSEYLIIQGNSGQSILKFLMSIQIIMLALGVLVIYTNSLYD